MRTSRKSAQSLIIIKEQQQSGQTVRAWCSERGISTKTYYYRLRKVREAICQNVRQTAPEIAEIPLTTKEQSFTGIRITTANGTMDVNNASMETLERLLQIMPLNRISEEFARNDVNLSRGTLANWTIRCAERYLSLVYDRLKKHLCEQSVIQTDETTVGVTKDGRPGTAASYMFVYRTSELQKENPVILYKYEKTRGHEHAKEFLNGFNGTVVSDAFSGYKALERENEGIISAFCWAHARRSYADALKALKGPEKKHSKDTVAHKALIKIGNIYNAENNARSMSPDERYKYHQEKVLPLVEAYFAWVKEQNPVAILSEKTRDGLEYSQNNEKQLRKR